MTENAVLEIGVNDGADSRRLLSKFRGDYFGFEPIPRLFDQLIVDFKDIPRASFFPYAVDINPGTAVFHTGADDLGGVSSLFNLSDNGIELVSGRDISDTVTVEKIRLDEFIEQQEIKSIQYLWIDAQGNDFNVIRSLGEKLSIVAEGKCEASYQRDLYVGADNGYRDICSYLSERGFDVALVPAGGLWETDVHFRRRTV